MLAIGESDYPVQVVQAGAGADTTAVFSALKTTAHHNDNRILDGTKLTRDQYPPGTMVLVTNAQQAEPELLNRLAETVDTKLVLIHGADRQTNTLTAALARDLPWAQQLGEPVDLPTTSIERVRRQLAITPGVSAAEEADRLLDPGLRRC